MTIAATFPVQQTKAGSGPDLALSNLNTDAFRRAELGQFLTPKPVADFMASLFECRWRNLDLLDAGAGTGTLSAALIRRICAKSRKPAHITVTAYEVDSTLIMALRETLSQCQRDCERAGISFSATILNEDFIEAAVVMVRQDLFSSQTPRFNAAIVNPPYRKIRSDSTARLSLRSADIETSNLYTGFISLIIKLLADEAELVSITPRSFCNGPYYRPFRDELLQAMALRQLHLFESRTAAFKGDGVMQENIVVHAVKGRIKPERVTVSSSSGEADGPVTERTVLYREVVSPDDSDQFIHLVADTAQAHVRPAMEQLATPLAGLGLAVSTGRVVDFRAKSFLRQTAEKGTVPLIYPCHFNGGCIHWPKEKSRKPNAILCNNQTRALLVPAGIYVLVKRFTSKEERRRIVACIYDPEQIQALFVGFENHLNYFHAQGGGLPLDLAKGLAAFLNSTFVDVYFRQFNGHTQVNATDLRSFNYPRREQLELLGRKISSWGAEQEVVDELVKGMLNGEV